MALARVETCVGDVLAAGFSSVVCKASGRYVWTWSYLRPVLLLVWLALGLGRLVQYENVVVHSLVLRGVLCELCVKLGALLELRVRPFDGCELHVARRCT